MPKRAVSASPESPAAWPPALPAWRAIGLSLAPIGAAIFNGVAGLCATAIAAVLVFAFARLHRYAPQAVSTGDLVAATVGPAAGRFTSLVQLAAYALLGVGAALTLALQPLTGAPDLETALAGWWWPGWSVAVVVIAGAVVAYLPTRAVGATAGVLAGVGLLVFFYLALAILARVAAGTPPMMMGGSHVDSVLLATAAAIPLGLGLVGFEAATVVSGRLESVARPVGTAVGITALGAATLLVAANVGATGGFHNTAVNLSLIISQFFADAGYYWFTTGALCLGSAALLALMWAATRVAGRLFGAGPEVALLVPAVMCVLALAFSRFQDYLGRLQMAVPALLLLVVYVLVTEANSRIEGSAAAQQTPRLILVVVGVGVVLIPLRVTDFSMPALWPLVVTAAILAVAALLARLGRPVQPARPPH
ncbi:APC family permease [Mycobacterium sp. DL440]|uniref:APC family permease n=1 Tax=Mycobacterium sp. DL440 TaxID=2675523 RepID=UPI00142229D2|nr:APC family permease [Mycobacterium sp. DL440]